MFLVEPSIPKRFYLDEHTYTSDISDGRNRFSKLLSAIRENQFEGAIFVIRKLRDKISYETKMLIFYLLFKLSKFLGYRIPLEWRRFNVQILHRRITNQYIAKLYTGPVTICQTEPNFKRSAWVGVLKGDIELRSIKETQQRADLFHDTEIVNVWLNHLKAFLKRIRKAEFQ
jgi:hypothetical protein